MTGRPRKSPVRRGARQRSRTLAPLVITALVFSLLVTPTTATAAPRGCAPILDSVFVESLSVTGKAAKKRYRRGQKAVINVSVSRPGREDPAGAGIPLDPPTSAPAADALVGIGVYVGDDFLFAHGITDSSGNAEIKLKIPRDVPTGVAELETYSWKLIANYSCGSAFEFGYNIDLKAFRVVKGKRR